MMVLDELLGWTAAIAAVTVAYSFPAPTVSVVGTVRSSSASIWKDASFTPDPFLEFEPKRFRGARKAKRQVRNVNIVQLHAWLG